MSYRGSEISIFISPQPAVAINLDSLERHTTSWRGRSKAKLIKNAMIDSSSSEHNLSRYSYANSSGYSFTPFTSSSNEKNLSSRGRGGGGATVAIPKQICWRHVDRDFSFDSMLDVNGGTETVT
ncbi:unnamed protein product [Litomosoides sigmodontis]|uniref:Uncharacterized protein n=1 Tax=Litomosoides sigmodontis TaxID=42156 RepID=A0A3P6SI46_LITSI|nr:unnamed protein product [Litomosoides sigmodontis]